jgi:serine protease Do
MDNHLKVFISTFISFLYVFIFSALVVAQNNIEFLDKDLINELNFGIYEVVTPKKENNQITYARELPFETLDFVERNEKYYSIGTAFFINNKDLMTAAHVFGLEYFSLLQDFYIRDAAGKVYPVNLVKRYSTHRDMVVFNLKSYPEKIRPLRFNGEVAVGDTVFSVGNAQGEGIAYRAGQVASFTPEWQYGKWKDIRFTSPASPGNSGGPLLNIKGEVVGLIVKKNESENYNISVPIAELDNLSDTAEFHLRNLSYGLVGVDDTLTRDWSFTLPLPAPIEFVAMQAQDNLDKHLGQLGEDLTEMVQDRNYPKGERFRSYLRDQSYIKGFGVLLPETNFNKWDVQRLYQEKIPISASQNVYRGKGFVSDLQVIVEKPENLTLKEFIDSPDIVMENLLKGVSITRPVGQEKIPITSFGKPEMSTMIQDQLGRKWISSLWNLPYSDYFLHSSCLPYPRGVICNIDSKGNGYRKYGYFRDVYDSYDEIVVGYSGEIIDWVEYFSLEKKYLPQLFQDSQITLNNNTLQVKVDAFTVEFTSKKITEKSSIHLHLGYSNDKLLAEDLLLFELFPEKGAKSHYRIKPFFEPDAFNSDTYTSRWNDIINSTGEYSAKPVDKGDKIVIKKGIPGTKVKLTTFNNVELSKIMTAGCYYKTTDVEIEDDCASFFNSITFH